MFMTRFYKKLYKKGSILFMTALSSIFLIGMTALVTDIGYMYYNQSRIQTAVNAGWKAGYDRMMMLKSGDGQLSDSERTQVIAHIKEVMKVNGYTDEELANLEVTFGPNNQLYVGSSQNVGLFFARAMDFNAATVTASRENHAQDIGQGIVPLAIPFGVTKDLTKNTYLCELFAQNPDGTYDPNAQGFASGSEYILKLGSGGPNSGDPGDPFPEVGKILVPMDSNAQSDRGFLRAYGAAYWCLKIDENDPGFVPVEWLLGYRGGAFLLPNDNDVKKILRDYDVNYEEITDGEELQAIYDAVNPNVLELYNRPAIAVYSSQGDPDPVEVVLRKGRIPYGEYSKPGEWPRNRKYSESNCSNIYDDEILSGVLDDYEWLHLHHEDFTGFCGGCDFFLYSCKDSLDDGHIGSKYSSSTRENMCEYCRNHSYMDWQYYRYYGWYQVIDWDNNYNEQNCHNLYRRCVDKADYQGNKWPDNPDIYICRKGNTGYPQCWWDGESLKQTADAHGFTSDPNSSPKPQYPVNRYGNNPLPDNPDGWFNKATKVQKMKWAVVDIVKTHVFQGGFLFAQCFAPETFDLALWQSAIYNGASPSQAYNNCLAFTDFHYKTFPMHYGATWYSDINSRDGRDDFNLLNSVDPRCQNHGSDYCCDTGSGHTASFIKSQIKPETTILGYQQNTGNNYVKYLKGTHGNGDFTFLGGHYHHNVEAERLVLNNILLGSLVEKNIGGGGTTPVSGKQKSNYGPVDPDNIGGGGANDYRDRFKFGFNQPLDLNDRIVPEPGNMRGPTDQAVDFRINGDNDYTPNRIVIVPITDVPPEVPENNSQNADAKTVYDLQGKDHPNGSYDPDDYDFGSSVRIIGFAAFEIIGEDEYSRDGDTYSSGDSGDLGPYQPGQVRGRFLRYIVKPGEMPVN